MATLSSRSFSRGFGASTGTPTEQGLYDDATAAYRYLIRTERVAAERESYSRAARLVRPLPSTSQRESQPPVCCCSRPSIRFPASPHASIPGRRYACWRATSSTALRRPRRSTCQWCCFTGGLTHTCGRPTPESCSTSFEVEKLMVKTGGGHHHAGFVDSAVLYKILGEIPGLRRPLPLRRSSRISDW